MTHKKDILEKNLLAYNDVFADIINAIVPLEESTKIHEKTPCRFDRVLLLSFKFQNNLD